MAASSVMLPETLRIWRAAGLRHILVEGGSGLSPLLDRVAPQPSPMTSPMTSPMVSPTTSPLVSPMVWPPPWDRLRNQLNQPSHSIWTYLALGEDMGGRRVPERGKTLRQLVAALAWPKGSIAFWPLAVLEEDCLRENLTLFRQGVEYVGASHVVCFGEEGFGLLRPEQGFAPGEYDCPFLPSLSSLLVLPDLESLSPERSEGWREALSLLRTISPA